MGLLSKIGFEASIGDAFKSVVSGKHVKDRADRDRDAFKSVDPYF